MDKSPDFLYNLNHIVSTFLEVVPKDYSFAIYEWDPGDGSLCLLDSTSNLVVRFFPED